MKDMSLPPKTILAIPGAGMHAGIWGGMAPHLLGFAFRPVSLPAHDAGGSGGLLPAIQDMAAFLRERLRDQPPESHVLMGHSMGALVALEAAFDPAVCAVILLGAAAKMPVNAELLKTAADNPEEAGRLIAKWGVFSGHPKAEAMRTVVGAVLHATAPKAVGNDLQACNNYRDGEEAARALKKPALVLSGAEDKMTRVADSTALSGMIAGAKHVVLERCGHMIMVEKPIEAAAEIRKFFDKKD